MRFWVVVEKKKNKGLLSTVVCRMLGISSFEIIAWVKILWVLEIENGCYYERKNRNFIERNISKKSNKSTLIYFIPAVNFSKIVL